MARFKVGDIIVLELSPDNRTNLLILDIEEPTESSTGYYIFLALETGRNGRNKISYIDRIAGWVT